MKNIPGKVDKKKARYKLEKLLEEIDLELYQEDFYDDQCSRCPLRGLCG